MKNKYETSFNYHNMIDFFDDKKFLQHAECKRRINFELMREMCYRKPRATVFIDLFGGAGAMTCMALEFTPDIVLYNEFDKGIFTFTKNVFYYNYTPPTIARFNKNKIPEDWYDKTKCDLSIFGVLPEDWYYLQLQRQNAHCFTRSVLRCFGNKSYDKIDLTQFNNEKCIVYCDIRNLHVFPYRNYYGNDDFGLEKDKFEDVDFDYNKFEEWLKEQRNKGYDVFVSEYTQQKNTTEIWSITTQSNMGSVENKEEVKERLFVN